MGANTRSMSNERVLPTSGRNITFWMSYQVIQYRYAIRGKNGMDQAMDGRISIGESLEYDQHSRDGFAWGYSGNGATQTALACCLILYGPAGANPVIYQGFKEKHLLGLAKEESHPVLKIRAPFLNEILDLEYLNDFEEAPTGMTHTFKYMVQRLRKAVESSDSSESEGIDELEWRDLARELVSTADRLFPNL